MRKPEVMEMTKQIHPGMKTPQETQQTADDEMTTSTVRDPITTG
jgi:hypothetical protein